MTEKRYRTECVGDITPYFIVDNATATKKNKYTGMFKGYNLIYITAESFSEIGVSKELTPTLLQYWRKYSFFSGTKGTKGRRSMFRPFVPSSLRHFVPSSL